MNFFRTTSGKVFLFISLVAAFILSSCKQSEGVETRDGAVQFHQNNLPNQNQYPQNQNQAWNQNQSHSNGNLPTEIGYNPNFSVPDYRYHQNTTKEQALHSVFGMLSNVLNNIANNFQIQSNNSSGGSSGGSGGIRSNPPPPTPDLNGLSQDHQNLLTWHNEARAKVGAGPLQINTALTQAATAYAGVMNRVKKMGHSVDGSDFSNRIKQAGYSYRNVAENVAYCHTAKGAMDCWLKSPGHYKNIVNPALKEVGFGLSGPYQAANFGTR